MHVSLQQDGYRWAMAGTSVFWVAAYVAHSEENVECDLSSLTVLKERETGPSFLTDNNPWTVF